MSAGGVSRRALLSGAAAAAAAAVSLPVFAEPSPGIAGLVSKIFFPKEGFNAPELTNPSGVVVDQTVLGTAEAKEALEKLRGYKGLVEKVVTDFEAAPATFDVAATFKKDVKIDGIRMVLNVVNEAFDEETQKQTDKVVRGIIQDVGELQYNGGVKEGAQRTPKKIERTRQWLTKISSDVTYLAAFFN